MSAGPAAPEPVPGPCPAPGGWLPLACRRSTAASWQLPSVGVPLCVPSQDTTGWKRAHPKDFILTAYTCPPTCFRVSSHALRSGREGQAGRQLIAEGRSPYVLGRPQSRTPQRQNPRSWGTATAGRLPRRACRARGPRKSPPASAQLLPGAPQRPSGLEATAKGAWETWSPELRAETQRGPPT